MTDYQTLLDEAVSLVQAERGFIVRRDAITGAPCRIIARHNFNVRPYPPTDGLFTEEMHLWTILTQALMADAPTLTHSANSDLYYHRIKTGEWPLRSILIVPFAGGALWCDVRVRHHVFKPPHVDQAAALVAMRIQVS